MCVCVCVCVCVREKIKYLDSEICFSDAKNELI